MFHEGRRGRFDEIVPRASIIFRAIADHKKKRRELIRASRYRLSVLFASNAYCFLAGIAAVVAFFSSAAFFSESLPNAATGTAGVFTAAEATPDVLGIAA